MIRKDPSGLHYLVSADALIGYLLAFLLVGFLVWCGYAFGVSIERERCERRLTLKGTP